MKPNRRLSLRREALSALQSDELASVFGGTHVRTDCNCLTHGYTCDACPIPTLPINTCFAIATGLSCEVCIDGTR